MTSNVSPTSASEIKPWHRRPAPIIATGLASVGVITLLTGGNGAPYLMFAAGFALWPKPKPCDECGIGAVSAFNNVCPRLLPFTEPSRRAGLKKAKVCKTCLGASRRWRCRDCPGEMSSRLPAAHLKPPICLHCGGATTLLQVIPDGVRGDRARLTAWIGSVPSAEDAARNRMTKNQEQTQRLAALLEGRECRQVDYVGGFTDLREPMPALLLGCPEGIVLVKRTFMKQFDASVAGIIDWASIHKFDVQMHREGSDASKVQGMMLGTRPGAGNLGAAAGLVALFSQGEHTVELLLIHVRHHDGFEGAIAIKAKEAQALAGYLSGERTRFLALRSKTEAISPAPSPARPSTGTHTMTESAPSSPATPQTPVPDKPWYHRSGTVTLFLFLFFPVGLWLMWSGWAYPVAVRVIVSVFFGMMIVASAGSDRDRNREAGSDSGGTTETPPVAVAAEVKTIACGSLFKGYVSDGFTKKRTGRLMRVVNGNVQQVSFEGQPVAITFFELRNPKTNLLVEEHMVWSVGEQSRERAIGLCYSAYPANAPAGTLVRGPGSIRFVYLAVGSEGVEQLSAARLRVGGSFNGANVEQQEAGFDENLDLPPYRALLRAIDVPILGGTMEMCVAPAALVSLGSWDQFSFE